MVGLGMDTWGSVVEEGTYGTSPGTGESYFKIISETLTEAKDINYSESLCGASPKNTFAGARTVGGELTVELLYQGFLLFLKHALGAYSGAADTPVAGAHTHTITEADALPTGLSVELSKGNIPSGKVFLYQGCKINSIDFQFDTGTIMKAVLGIIAQSETADTTASGTPSYPTWLPMLWRFAGSLTFAGTSAVPIISGNILQENMLSADRFLMNDTIREPVRTEQRKVTGEIVTEFADLALYDKWKANTTGAMTLTFTNDTLITGATYSSIAFTLQKIQLTGKTPEVSGAGAIQVPFSFLALHDGGSNDQLKIEIVSGETVLS